MRAASVLARRGGRGSEARGGAVQGAAAYCGQRWHPGGWQPASVRARQPCAIAECYHVQPANAANAASAQQLVPV